jgi:predicted nucleic acid-binding protein
MTPSEQIVVCDAGPLIHLDEVACLDLLSDFSLVLVPEIVWQEVAIHRPAALYYDAVAFERLPQGKFELPPALEHLYAAFDLDSGERAALLLMHYHPKSIFLTDDAAARLAAQTLGYKVHGTVGILLRSIRRNQRSRDEIVALLEHLPSNSTLHITKALLQEVISAAKAG